MIKTVGLFELPEGVDQEEYWRDHVVGHSQEMLELGGDLLRGYIINRFRAQNIGRAKFWGMVELWFDDEAARTAFNERTSIARFKDSDVHFEDFVVDFSATEVQEHVVIPPHHAP